MRRTTRLVSIVAMLLAAAGPSFAALFLNQDIDVPLVGLFAAGDFNGDGRDDLAVSAGSSVAVFLNDGAGVFGAGTMYAAGAYPGAVVIGDLNGDGRKDIVAVSESSLLSPNLSILLGNGDGTFGAAIQRGGLASPGIPAIGDFNGDGRQDLAVPLRNFSSLAILLGRGNGTFDPTALVALGTSSECVAVGHLNADAAEDLVVAAPGKVLVLMGNGNGSFGTPSEITVGFDNTLRHVATRDLNGDGLDEFAVADQTGSELLVFTNLGNGLFSSPAHLQEPAGPVWVTLADLDADGVTDAMGASGRVTVHYGLPGGGFACCGGFLVGDAPSGRAIAVTDLDGNGNPDMAASNSGGVAILLCSDTPGELGAPQVAGWNHPTYVAAGELNGDGDADLVGFSDVDNGAHVKMGQGNGDFDAGVFYPTGTRPVAAAIADFDGDQANDLAVANSQSNDVSVLLNLGNGSFGPETRVASGAGPSSIVAGDLDLDGSVDLAVANANGDSIAILRGDGAGGFTAYGTYAVGRQPTALALTDLNGDAILDLAALCRETTTAFGIMTPAEIAVLIGTGSGTFVARPRIRVSGNPLWLASGDLDGDGLSDLALAKDHAGGTVVLGRGDGWFRPEVALAPSFAPWSFAPDLVAVADLTADGNQDLVFSSSTFSLSGDRLFVYPGDGHGGFAPLQRYFVNDDPRSFAIADLDRDGRTDVAVPSYSSGLVTVLLNRGAFPDRDKDGVPDPADTCTDSDGDGRGDPGYPANTCPPDNCPLTPNPDQQNADGDAKGDACDTCPFDPSADFDGDGRCGGADNCLTTKNKGQEDSDGDGEGDACDRDDGLILISFLDAGTLAWQFEAGYDSFNVYRGDLQALRQQGLYTQDPAVTPAAARFCDRPNDVLAEPFAPSPGQIVFYLVSGESLGVEGSLGMGPAGERPNANPCPICDRPFTPILYDTGSGKPAQNLVIDNLTAWCAFYPPACSAGLVDFATEVALVTAIGERPDSCYNVAITCAKQNGSFDNLEVTYTESCPGPGTPCLGVIVEPMHVVKVPRPVAAASFTRTTVGPCP